MIPLFRFLYSCQILLKLLFIRPRRAVNTLQHFIAGIAAPIGACHFGQLKRLKLASARHMRATAQVHPGTLLIERDLLVLG